MNKLTSVTLTAAMIVVIFLVVYLFKVFQHDVDSFRHCVDNASTCSITK